MNHCQRPPARASAQDLDRHVEHVACAALSLDVRRLRRVRLELAAKPENLDIDRAVVDFGSIESRKLEQLVARQDASRGRAKCLEQTELSIGELDSFTLRRDETPRSQIQFPTGEAVCTPLLVPRGQ